MDADAAAQALLEAECAAEAFGQQYGQMLRAPLPPHGSVPLAASATASPQQPPNKRQRTQPPTHHRQQPHHHHQQQQHIHDPARLLSFHDQTAPSRGGPLPPHPHSQQSQQPHRDQPRSQSKARRSRAKRDAATGRPTKQRPQSRQSVSVPAPKLLDVACVFWAQGYCGRGDQCRWSHAQAPIRRQERCKYFASGQCARGTECTFSHDLGPCRYFFLRDPAKCLKGASCLYSHAGPLTVSQREQLIAEVEAERLQRQAFPTAEQLRQQWLSEDPYSEELFQVPDRIDRLQLLSVAAAAPISAPLESVVSRRQPLKNFSIFESPPLPPAVVVAPPSVGVVVGMHQPPTPLSAALEEGELNDDDDDDDNGGGCVRSATEYSMSPVPAPQPSPPPPPPPLGSQPPAATEFRFVSWCSPEGWLPVDPVVLELAGLRSPVSLEHPMGEELGEATAEAAAATATATAVSLESTSSSGSSSVEDPHELPEMSRHVSVLAALDDLLGPHDAALNIPSFDLFGSD